MRLGAVLLCANTQAPTTDGMKQKRDAMGIPLVLRDFTLLAVPVQAGLSSRALRKQPIKLSAEL